MHTLDDLRSFRDAPYGLVDTYNKFRNTSSLNNLVDAKRDWHGIPEGLDLQLEQRYGKRWGQADWPGLPLIAAFRHAVIEAFEEMPKDIEECRDIFMDAIVTLRTLETLDTVTPFLRNETPHILVKKLEETTIDEEHISTVPVSIVVLEQECTKQWNERRKKQHLAPMDPLTEVDVRHMLLGRNDTQGVKIHTHGNDDEVSGYAIMREPYDEQTGVGLDLIAWAADDERGYPDALASLVVLRLENETRKRLNFALRTPA